MANTMTRWILSAALAAAFLFLGACALAPEQQEAVRVVFDELLRDGKITYEQHAALIAALTQGDWSYVWAQLAEIGVAIGGALLGVRVWRGGITSRRGAVVPMITQEVPAEPAPAPAPVKS
jgi:hypothetical protein